MGAAHQAVRLARSVGFLCIMAATWGPLPITAQDAGIRADSARVAFGDGRLDQATRLLDQLALDFPEDAGIRWLLAQVLRESGETVRAVENYRRAVELNPEDQWLRLEFGRVLVEGRRRSEGITVLAPVRTLLDVPGAASEAELLTGLAHYWDGDLASGERHLERSLELDPNRGEASVALRDVRAQRAISLESVTAFSDDDQPLQTVEQTVGMGFPLGGRARGRLTGTAYRRVAIAAALIALSASSLANPDYETIEYTQSDRTITLTGQDMTLEDVIAIARRGATVELSDEARQRAADAYGLLLQGAAEGVPIYWFNRGAGSARHIWMFQGSPMTPENKKYLEERQLASFRGAGLGGYPPELDEEALVRAMMAIRSNTMTYEAASPGLTQALLDLLNYRITPVVKARGSLGEGDLGIVAQLGGAMVGAGEVYYRGERMPASEALEKAGLEPLKPFGADTAALISTNVYAIAQTALLLDEAERLLDWNDMSYAMAVNGMNSSLTPISMPVQTNRPYPWLNWNAGKIMDMVSGSYLLEADPDRIIQDPISMRASTQRAGSAWKAWAQLRDTTLIAMNSSDHNPAVRPGLTPDSSPELATSQFMQYYIRGGELSNGKSGYILSNSNWDPYPMANEIEYFTIGLANLYVAVTQRIERFSNPFFTVIENPDRFNPGVGGYLPVALWQELSGHINPVAPQGQAIVATVEDLEAQTWLKVTRARQAVDVGMHLTAQDILTAAHWMELRKAQDPSRSFGEAPTAALAALREAVPKGQRTTKPVGVRAYEFMWATPATTFYPGGPSKPPGIDIPRVGAD